MIETDRWCGQRHRSNPWVGDYMKPKSISDCYRILRAHYRLSRVSVRFDSRCGYTRASKALLGTDSRRN